MSLTNPPSTAAGPGSVSAARSQTLKRSVQSSFEGMDRVGFADRPRRFASSRPFRVSRPQTLYYPLPSHPHPELVTHSSRACGYPTSPSFPSFFFRLSQVTASWGAFLGDAAASGSSQPFVFFFFRLSLCPSDSHNLSAGGPVDLVRCWCSPAGTGMQHCA